MAKKQETPETPEPKFEQEFDPLGRMRLDRPLMPAEAAAQDAEHVRLYEQNRRKRFGPQRP